MWYYEEAISIYCCNKLAKATLPKDASAEFSYANALNNAAQMLMAAAAKEDQQKDFAEIIAETLVATYLFNAAKATYAEVKKVLDNGTFIITPRQLFDDNQRAADDGAKDSQAKLNSYKI
jgi:hypothetical protein